MKKAFILFVIAMCTVQVAQAQRGGRFNRGAAPANTHIKTSLSLFKYDLKTEGPTLGTSESSRLFYDFKLGYHYNSIYLGGIYSSRAVESGATEDQRTSYGLSLGYHSGGTFLDLSYFINASRTIGATEYTQGTGLGVDLGYNFGVTPSFFMGLQASYKTFTYKEVNATEEENKELSELQPMINLGFVF